MVQHSHRARSGPGRGLILGVALAVLALVVGGIFVVSRTGDSAAAEDRADARNAAAEAQAQAEADAEAARAAKAERIAARQARKQRRFERLQQAMSVKTRERAIEILAKHDAADRYERKLKREKRREKRRQARLEARQNAPFTIKVGSFNVLGSQHTGPGGPRPYPAASVRSVGAANLMSKHGVDVVGTQELQDDQLRQIQGRTGFAAYPGFAWGVKETDNSILYDDSQFEFVSGSKFTITFMGRPRPQPILRLRVRDTGREFYVVNTHPSAGGGRYAAERARGRSTLISVVNGLKSEGIPIFVTGDMNDREPFFCQGVAAGGLVSSSGGSYGSGCKPPPGPIPVDWVVSTNDVSWTDYWRDTAATDNRISDHFFISATAHVG
ncbi:endonuclease/exonuclease/phosphatase family protein [Nocardioides sp. GXZ039]|uniref:endonuclease/exonuclease/phosphatase family protein n=1 Tax=Nocardioides sp. GXZ039 TaxID=3136018 RepID=UPI0030F49D1C